MNLFYFSSSYLVFPVIFFIQFSSFFPEKTPTVLTSPASSVESGSDLQFDLDPEKLIDIMEGHLCRSLVCDVQTVYLFCLTDGAVFYLDLLHGRFQQPGLRSLKGL